MLSKELSIGINGSMLDDKPTGVGIYSFNLINNLSKINKDDGLKKITVFTPSSSFLNKDVKTVKISKYLLSSKYGKIAAAYRFLWNTFYYTSKAKKFNVLINPTTHGSLLLNNQIFTIHDLLSLRFKNISPHQRFYFKYILPLYIKKAKLIITVSESTKKDVINFFNCPSEKIKVVHNGYDDSIFFYDANHKPVIEKQFGIKNYILAIGPTYPHKNFELLISVYNEFPDNYKQQHPLVIPGGLKKYLSVIKNLVFKLKAEKHVFFLDYVPLQFMPSLYREAFTLVFPSLFEGFGIPLLEAMASGCPVVTSNTSSVPEVCEDAVLYFDPLQASSLHAALSKLSSEQNLRDELIARGLVQSKKFSWMKMALEFDSIIENTYTNN